jgi:hypothetical protein
MNELINLKYIYSVEGNKRKEAEMLFEADLKPEINIYYTRENKFYVTYSYQSS